MKWRRTLLLLLFLGPIVALSATGSALRAQVQIFRVTAAGSDESGDGSVERPWATISHAVDSVPDVPNVIVLVGDGRYPKERRWSRRFESPLTVRAETRYGAILEMPEGEFLTLGGRRVTLGGFDFAAGEKGSAIPIAPPLLHVVGEEIRITDCRFGLEGSSDGDHIEISGGASEISIENSLIARPSDGRDGIRVSRAVAVSIVGNILHTGGGELGLATDRSLIHAGAISRIRESATGTTQGLRIERNLLVNASSNPGRALIGIGRGSTELSAEDLIIENNLFLGLPGAAVLAPIGLYGTRSTRVRANTIVGDFPAQAFLIRSLASNAGLSVYNNIITDPSGSMDPLALGGFVGAPALGNNLFWNAGRAIPDDGPLKASRDGRAIVADPLLPDPASLRLELQDLRIGPVADHFARLATFAHTAAGSPAIDRADGEHVPLLDLLGRPRGVPDVGALEHRGVAAGSATPSALASPTAKATPTAGPSQPRMRLYLPLLGDEAISLSDMPHSTLATARPIRYK